MVVPQGRQGAVLQLMPSTAVHQVASNLDHVTAVQQSGQGFAGRAFVQGDLIKQRVFWQRLAAAQRQGDKFFGRTLRQGFDKLNLSAQDRFCTNS